MKKLLTFFCLLASPVLTFAQSQVCDYVRITNVLALPDSTVFPVCDGTVHNPGHVRTEALRLDSFLVWLNAHSTGWSRTGNSGTNPLTDYAGTSDSVSFILGSNGATNSFIKFNALGNQLYQTSNTNGSQEFLVYGKGANQNFISYDSLSPQQHITQGYGSYQQNETDGDNSSILSVTYGINSPISSITANVGSRNTIEADSSAIVLRSDTLIISSPPTGSGSDSLLVRNSVTGIVKQVVQPSSGLTQIYALGALSIGGTDTVKLTLGNGLSDSGGNLKVVVNSPVTVGSAVGVDTATANIGLATKWTTWDVIYKAAANDTTSSTTAVNTSLVTGTLSTSSMYEFETVMEVTNNADVGGSKFAINVTGTGSPRGEGVLTGSTSSTAAGSSGLTTLNTLCSTSFNTASSGFAIITIKGIFMTDTGSPTFAIKFARTTTGICTVTQNSILKIKKLN